MTASAPAERTALEVLAANGVTVVVQSADGYTPTPAVSRAILAYNEGRTTGLADGIVITPSHNPPADGGFKYNPPDGGPADTDVTGWIQQRANALLAAGNAAVRRISVERARAAATTHEEDLVEPYVRELGGAFSVGMTLEDDREEMALPLHERGKAVAEAVLQRVRHVLGRGDRRGAVDADEGAEGPVLRQQHR